MKNTHVGICLLLSAVALTARADIKPVAIDYVVRPLYGYRADGTPGRIVTIKLKGNELKGNLSVEVSAKGKTEKSSFALDAKDSTEVCLMLPSSLPTSKKYDASITLRGADKTYKQKVSVAPMRHWNVYLYNHAHVDVGYTNTQKNVEELHKNNVIEGIKLAEETQNHPDGSRFVWNPEVSWPMERLWHSNPDMRERMLEALKKGQLCLDASYVNTNTSVCVDEELFHLFEFSRKMQQLSGAPSDVFQQFDIPGMSWGLIPVMVQEGIKYIISWPNTDRAGNAHNFGMDGKPFWWVGPDGKSKVLFFQPGGYGNSGSMKKGGATGRPWFGQRDARKVPKVIRTGSADVDFTDKLTKMEEENYPYDFAVFSWSLWDNNPLDADIPYAVKEWNDKYAYPKIRVCGGHEIMTMIEEKYGDSLPTVSGDYTEYWTDGLGTAAGLTAKNRNAKERLVQAETIWSMLADGSKAPREDFDEAWRYVLLSTEHTWCFENPEDPYFQDAIWKKKQALFHEAEERSLDMMDMVLAPVTDKSMGGGEAPEGPSKGGIAVFNMHTWPMGGVVKLSAKDSKKGNKVIDQSGSEVLSQRLSTGELLFKVQEVPALGSAHFRVVEGECTLAGSCRVDGTTLENDLLTARIDPSSGNIVTLKKKGSDYNYVAEGANTFAWLPANVDDPKADTVKAISVVENGPLAVEILVTSKAIGCRGVSRSVRLQAGQPWVEISNIVDKLPLKDKDGIHFGFAFNIPNSKTRVDIPWGVMEVEKDQWKQANRNWMAMQRWVDVSNNERGVTWCSLDAAMFEYGNRYANIAMSWGSKGNWITQFPQSSTVYSWAMNNHWHTNFPSTQDGPVLFRYRMYPHEAFDVVETNRFGLGQTQPLVYVPADKDPETQPLIAIDNPKVYATIIKSLATDGAMIVRLRSLSEGEENVVLTFPGKTPKRVSVCEKEDISSRDVSGNLVMMPYGQKTLRLEY